MQHFIANHGVLAVFLLMALESACVPIPSEVIMLIGGALAAGAIEDAHPSLVLVIIAGVVGNVVGSYVAWAVGRFGGPAVIRRFGRYVFLREHDLEKAERWFERRGAASVLVGRLLPVIRTFISLPAGIAAMPPLRFGVYTTLGCIPWTAALGIAGYAVGDHWEKIANAFHGPSYIIAAVVAVALIILAARHVKRRRAAATAEPASGEPVADEPISDQMA
ncbi:DedA family protein [Pseudofrankia saprophytica]|uniref:DedA family protein n=1 Tax=Pseudofrankia saprophytica TaxID=298655 RepID=UPI000234B4BA|nr:DedA family protein [Pseudofrankia saprophytica]